MVYQHMARKGSDISFCVVKPVAAVWAFAHLYPAIRFSLGLIQPEKHSLS
jgi:hypothetical protein